MGKGKDAFGQSTTNGRRVGDFVWYGTTSATLTILCLFLFLFLLHDAYQPTLLTATSATAETTRPRLRLVTLYRSTSGLLRPRLHSFASILEPAIRQLDLFTDGVPLAAHKRDLRARRHGRLLHAQQPSLCRRTCPSAVSHPSSCISCHDLF